MQGGSWCSARCAQDPWPLIPNPNPDIHKDPFASFPEATQSMEKLTQDTLHMSGPSHLVSKCYRSPQSSENPYTWKGKESCNGPQELEYSRESMYNVITDLQNVHGVHWSTQTKNEVQILPNTCPVCSHNMYDVHHCHCSITSYILHTWHFTWLESHSSVFPYSPLGNLRGGTCCQFCEGISSAAIPRWTFRVSSDPRRQASQGPESIDVGDQSRTLCCRRYFFCFCSLLQAARGFFTGQKWYRGDLWSFLEWVDDKRKLWKGAETTERGWESWEGGPAKKGDVVKLMKLWGVSAVEHTSEIIVRYVRYMMYMMAVWERAGRENTWPWEMYMGYKATRFWLLPYIVTQVFHSCTKFQVHLLPPRLFLSLLSKSPSRALPLFLSPINQVQ